MPVKRKRPEASTSGMTKEETLIPLVPLAATFADVCF